MDDWINIDISFPVLGVSFLPFITLLPLAPDSYRDNAEDRLLKVTVRRTHLEQACRIKIIVLHIHKTNINLQLSHKKAHRLIPQAFFYLIF